MQLFSKNNQKNTIISADNASQDFIEGKISSFSVAIISTNKQLIDNIRAILFLYNVLSIEVFSLDLNGIKEDTRWRDFDIFIIDIAQEKDAEKIAADINRFIPIRSTTILVGENDSIIFADLLTKKGIHFLLKDKQLEKIPDILFLRSSTPPGSSKRIGSVVTFLSCKGGIGTSSLIVHVLKNISQSTNYPILYIQGATTSQNADFLFEMPIDKEGLFTQIDQSLQVKIEQDDEIGEYGYLDSGSFNITILDQNIGLHSCVNKLESIVNLSNIIFLIVNRDPYSIKVAKNALEEVNRMKQKDNHIQNKRFLICINDNLPVDKKSSLQNVDIEEYLGKPINFTRKYIPSQEKFKKSYLDAEIESISAAVIGIEKEHKKHSTFSSFIAKKKR
ncbi:hypothetical protein RHO12_06730 [Orbus sturtevantii]|uniref:hypothetical protein n=1 Tax=Orbus sturtevantii TaxID=3074109 RepID=UPI00370D5093